MTSENGKDIYVLWKGPFNRSQAFEIKEEGIYQIYGHHPVYGPNALLYIGSSSDFSKRIKVHCDDWLEWYSDFENSSFYFGKIMNQDIEMEIEGLPLLEFAEGMLISIHVPAQNKKLYDSVFKTTRKGWRLMNFGNYKTLLPEISVDRWTETMHVHIDNMKKR